MAFNPHLGARRKQSTRAVSEDRASSFFSDSQASWVVFNPADLGPQDILSVSTETPLSGSEYEEDVLAEAPELGRLLKEAEEARDGGKTSPLQEPDDDLIDGFDMSLSNRINEWQKTTDDTSAVSDNVASWDLDEDLTHQVLDTTILSPVPAYYGDQFFKNMSRAEYMRFRRSSLILKQSLSRKGYKPNDPEVMSRLLSLLKWNNLLRSSGSLVDDYIANTLSRVHLQERTYKDVEFSDTATSSSLVMCGGSGSWNEI
ncbi:hypothetical protein JCM33374_g2364 [Metschnikowia sp. JCM 33374]|nr:hypothetical protein JCM33374_g2364 [Metschnikowia sp. JCM 33374]